MNNANYLSKYIIFLKIYIVNLRKWYTCFNLIQTLYLIQSQNENFCKEKYCLKLP